jgi:predicted DNA-binding antitoxin AbrB/MazE fold protein
MVRSVRAVYENGVFRPLERLEGLAERATVRLRVETPSAEGGRLSEFAGRWTGEEADEIASLIDAEFERVNPSDW